MQNVRKRIEVAAAIIIDGGKIFATQRGYGEFKDGWEFPGGKIEQGETPKQALVREIREELDTEIEVGELFDTVEYDYPDFHLILHCFLCTVKSGELVLKEHEAAKWLPKDSLDSVEWLPADVGLIEKLQESFDAFYSESNMTHLRRGVEALNAGKGVEHDIIEVDE